MEYTTQLNTTNQPQNQLNVTNFESRFKKIPPSQFEIGDKVIWRQVEPHEYGIIAGKNWTDETVHQTTEPCWHYLVKLHPNSYSYSFLNEDWAIEADLQLLSEFNDQNQGKLHENQPRN